ncbi:hypothetical protein DPMN_129914 [Dreissena polymorpha]|uniref:Uncharacterized protein n=1 Tax=Dreissena polymorpha TaxID=45954 RepID=A0A9D4H5T4_DREPO|nr:hypothetical protein DPMN_129914 [Dreissena polymorpha]
MEGDFLSHPASSVSERILRHNKELTGFVARMSEEKLEQRNTLSRLEEDIWQYRQLNGEYEVNCSGIFSQPRCGKTVRTGYSGTTLSV